MRVGNTAEVTIRLSTVPPGTDPKLAKLKVAFEEGVAASRAQNHDWRSPSSRRHWPSSPPAPSATSTSASPTCRRKTRSRPRRTGRRRSSRRPTIAETLNALATLYNNQKRFDEAAAVSTKAAASAPAGNADAIYNQGIILWNAGKIPEAKTKFEEAVKANPGHADARFQLGMALINEGKLPEAAASFEEYLKLAPTGQFAAQAKAMLAQLKPPAA